MTSRAANKVVWGLQALLSVLIVRCALSLVSYKRLRRWIPLRGVAVPDAAERSRVCWAVTRAAAWVPGASCLTQALAGQWILASRGYTSRVVIGVRRPSQSGLAAHAWLRTGGHVVLGADTDDLAEFTELTELGSPA